MIWPWLVLGGAAIFLLLVIGLVLLYQVGGTVAEAKLRFDAQHPQLEKLYFEAASASGKPRGLRWKAVEWAGQPEFGRERSTGRLAALVSVTIQFEAVEGSDMEGLPAVGNLRNASAVFFYHQKRWHTTGLTIFNLNPDEALNHLKNQYERLAADTR
jgi:hypothetical protein